jgi:oligopeptidase B
MSVWQRDHREVRHGATVVDNYYWLREKSNPKVVQYLEAENAYTKAMTGTWRPSGRALQRDAGPHQADGSLRARAPRRYLYYSRTEEGKQYPIQCRRKGSMEAPEEVLLDLNELGKSHKFVGLGAFVVSDDQNLLAYTVDYTGFRQYGLQVKDLRTGETLPDTTERVDSVVWAADNKTLFLTTEDAVTKRSDKLWRHVLGTAVRAALRREGRALRHRVDKTRDKKYILLEIEAKDTTEFRWLRADRPQGHFAVFLPREKKHRYYVDHRENLFYIRTNKDGRNFAVMTAPESDPAPKNWKVFIPQQDDVLIEDIDLFQDFAVVVESRKALDRCACMTSTAPNGRPIAFPEPVYAASPGGTPEFDSKTYRYNYQSFITPPSVSTTTSTGQSTLLKQQEVLGGYDPTQYAQRAPVGHRARRREGAGFDRLQEGLRARRPARRCSSTATAPTASARRDLFQQPPEPARPRHGYAIAHIRGGDEMGEKWREDGMLMKKKNTFFDFIDCAEYLIARSGPRRTAW